MAQRHLLGKTLGCGRSQPFPGKLRCQHHGPSVVIVHHAIAIVVGDDHKAVMLARALICVVYLDYGQAQYPRNTSPVDQVGLILGHTFINLFSCSLGWCPVRPDRPEKWSLGNFLYSSVYWRSTVICPARSPPPPHIRSARRVLSCKWCKGSWAVSATLCHSRCASPRSSPERKASKPLAGVSFDVYGGTIRILYGYTVIEASAD